MQKVLLALAGIAALALPANLAGAQSNNANPAAPGQDRVCLVTFETHQQAQAGADADVVSAKVLPRKAAQAQADYEQGGAVRVFEYGAATKATCERLDAHS